MSPAVFQSAPRCQPAASVRQRRIGWRCRVAVACSLVLLSVHAGAAETSLHAEVGAAPECTGEGAGCGQVAQSLPATSAFTRPGVERAAVSSLPSARNLPVEGALLQARLASPLARAYLDAVLSPQDGGRLEARGMGLQLRLPENEGELLMGRYVSGGGGLRPDLPIVGVRYSSRDLSLPPPVPARASSAGRRPASGQASAAPPAVDHRITLPGGTAAEPLGTLEFKLGELRGKAPARTVGSGLKLLPQGASDVSLEAGMLAQDAEKFESTGVPAASLSLRHGVGADQTLTARAVRAGDSLLLAGLSEFRLMGVATAGATVRERGQGMEPGWLLTHEYQAQGFNSRLRFEGLGGDVEPGGDDLLGTPSRRNAELSFSWALGAAQMFTLTAGDRIKLDGERAELLGLSSSVRSRNGTQFSMGLKHAVDGEDSTRFTLDWHIPLEGRKSGQRGTRPWWSAITGILR